MLASVLPVILTALLRVEASIVLIAEETVTGDFVRVGDSLPQNVSRYSVQAPEGTIAVWPLDTNGEERIWQLVPEKLREYHEMGYVRFGKLKNGQASPYYVGKQYKWYLRLLTPKDL